MQSTRCQHQSPLTTETVFGNGYLPLSIHPITLHTHCTTTGTAEKGFSIWNTSIRKPSTGSRNWSARIQLFATLMYRSQSPSKLTHQERDLELHFSRKDVQLPLPPKLLPQQSNDMHTLNMSC